MAFVVAGAATDDLVADLRGAVTAAINQGESLAKFQARFDNIVAKHGWSYRGKRDWRTRVIYDTNLRTSYAAGRWRQMQEVKAERPFWRYRHSHASAEPRQNHLAWDGTILRADDDWWHTHFPPNGWGCKCYVETLSQDDLDRMGRTVGEAPDSPTRSVQLKRRGRVVKTVNVPEGIDPGFAYAPGRAVYQNLKERKNIVDNLPRVFRANAKVLADEAYGMGPDLNLPWLPTGGPTPAGLSEEFAVWRQQQQSMPAAFPLATAKSGPAALLPPLQDNPDGLRDLTSLVIITRERHRHSTRDLKRARGVELDDADLDRLPEILADPDDILEDTQDKGLYLFTFTSADGRTGKVAVRANYTTTLQLGVHPLEEAITKAVRSAEYVMETDLAGRLKGGGLKSLLKGGGE